MAEERPRRGAREYERAGEQGREADEERACATEEGCDRAPEGVADEAAVPRPEHRHQADEGHREPDPEGSHIDERAAEEQQAADREQDDRQDVRSAAERVAQRPSRPRSPTRPPSQPR